MSRRDFVIDLETLGTGSNSLIMSIGMACVQDDSQDIYKLLNLDDQIRLGRTVDVSTMQWWSTQNTDLYQHNLQGNSHNFNNKDILEVISNIFNESPKDTYLWGYGSVFDNVLLKSLYETYEMVYPVFYRNDMCLRTLLSITNASGHTIPEFKSETPHHAYEDAKSEAKMLKYLLELNGVK